VRHNAPWHIEQIGARKTGVFGEFSAKLCTGAALGLLPHRNGRPESILESYAGSRIVDKGQRAYAVQEARELLRRTMHNDVFQWMSNATQTFHELPFLYKSDKRTIHGSLMYS
jgi:hypothetical protein